MSDTRNPPAFPQQCADALDVGMVHEGMSLRDWFAGQALVGILSDPARAKKKDATSSHWVASNAYAFADAMLAEREKGGEG